MAVHIDDQTGPVQGLMEVTRDGTNTDEGTFSLTFPLVVPRFEFIRIPDVLDPPSLPNQFVIETIQFDLAAIDVPWIGGDQNLFVAPDPFILNGGAPNGGQPPVLSIEFRQQVPAPATLLLFAPVIGMLLYRRRVQDPAFRT